MPWGKHHESMYTGSMFGSRPIVFAVWGYVIAHMRQDRTAAGGGECFVELNPRLLSAIFGDEPLENVEAAIEELTGPDPESRTKEESGRRLVPDETRAMRYRVVNGNRYREERDAEKRREQNREAKRRSRARK